MTQSSQQLGLAWQRDFITDGVMSSGKNAPKKSDGRAFIQAIAAELNALLLATGANVVKATLAALNGVTPTAGLIGLVLLDTTGANGVYEANGAAWVLQSLLPADSAAYWSGLAQTAATAANADAVAAAASESGALGYLASAEALVASIPLLVASAPFSGTFDGSSAAITLPATPTTSAQVLLFVGGIPQATSAFSISGTTLTLAETPPSGVPYQGFVMASAPIQTLPMSSRASPTELGLLTDDGVWVSSKGLGIAINAPLNPMSAYLTSVRPIRERFLDQGISIMEGGSTGGVAPGQGNAVADTASLQNLFADMGSLGGLIRVPNARDGGGIYYINDRIIVAPGKSVIAIMGESMARSVLRRVPNAVTDGTHDGLFKFSMDTPTQSSRQSIQIENLTCEVNFGSTLPAFSFDWATPVGAPMAGFIGRNITLSSDEKQNGAKFWAGGLQLTHCREPSLRDFYMFGPDNDDSSVARAISLEGGTVGFVGDNLQITGVDTAIFAGTAPGSSVPGACEGIVVNDSLFVYVKEGFVGVQTPNGFTDGHTLVGVEITNTHISAITNAVRLYGASNVWINDGQFQNREGTSGDYNDVMLAGYCSKVDIVNTDFQLRSGSGVKNCINILDVPGQDRITAINNTVQGRDLFLSVPSGATNVIARKNNASTDVTQMIANASTSNTNRFDENMPYDVVSGTIRKFLTANIAAPSVSGQQNRFFISLNSATTSITTFSDGYAGQEIQVVAGAHTGGTTTLIHGANLILIGSADRTFAGGAVAKFLCEDGTIWREI